MCRTGRLQHEVGHGGVFQELPHPLYGTVDTLFEDSLTLRSAAEFSSAITDCAKYLNGRGRGARYDGSFPGSKRLGSCSGLSGDASKFSAAYQTRLAKYIEAQFRVYSQANGWIAWTWKTEAGAAEEWSYAKGVCRVGVDRLDQAHRHQACSTAGSRPSRQRTGRATRADRRSRGPTFVSFLRPALTLTFLVNTVFSVHMDLGI